ncbi:MAG: M23 family metallopeptidase [Bacteroidota bacterium]|nr:M23 family metallopeptidase [Bacteroidota bacterium]
MRNKKEKTTILFVNKTAQGIKPMQISSSLILHWKKYVAIVAFMFLVLIGFIGLLMSNNIDQSKLQLALSTRVHSMRQVIAQVDTNAVHEKFIKIDKELSTINGFLKARGIKTVFKGPQGGEANNNDIISTEEISNFYEDYLGKIIYNISYTPLGYPYPGRITSTFGHRENPFTGENVETHKGLDIKGPLGGPVKAMAKGVVEFAGLRGGFGNCIMLKHGNGFETLYGHLSKILVRVDQKIEIGQQIGNIGSTGRSTGPHLHYEVHKNGQQINPASFLTLN